MTQKYKSNAIIPNEPYTLHVTFYIVTLVKRRGVVSSYQTGQGTGVDITNKIDKLNAVIKAFDTAWHQHLKKNNLLGETDLIVSRSYSARSYYIIYYGYQRSFKRIKRKNNYYVVTRNAKGRYMKFNKYEAVGQGEIDLQVEIVDKKKLDYYSGLTTIKNNVLDDFK